MLMLIAFLLTLCFNKLIKSKHMNIVILILIFLSMKDFHCIFLNSKELFSLENSEFIFMLTGLTLLIIFLSTLNSFYIVATNLFFSKNLVFMLLILIFLFCVDNVLMFYCLFEMALFPIFFLIMGWGYQPERLAASKWMLMYTLSASIPLLLFIFMYQEYFFISMFSEILLVKKSEHLSQGNFFLTFKSIVLMVGFLIKFPIFLFHTWLPRAHVEAPVSGSMILAGVLLKLAGLGMYRFLPLISYLPFISFVKGFSIWGGAMVGMICVLEKDMKKLIAYTSVSHMCFVIFTILSKNNLALTGSIFMMLAHGVCSSGLFSGANQMSVFSNSRSLLINQGYLKIWPSFTLFWFLLCLSNMGGPPTINFFSEVVCIIALLQASSLTSFPLLGLTFLAAAYSLILFSHSQYGQASLKKIISPSMMIYSNNLLHCYFLFLLMFFMIFFSQDF